MSKELEARIAALEKDVADIKRIRMVAANLVAQQAEDAANGKMARPVADKAVRMREDK